MKTLKELEKWLEIENPFHNAYYDWYKDAIEWIYNDIQQSAVLSVQGIEKYLQDLMNK